ncbi:hypothetical protein ASD30_25540 [Nocardioides sp. Root140]|nr:hypothetical protein ASD30_25540 [Nocardioides sp. Root140]
MAGLDAAAHMLQEYAAGLLPGLEVLALVVVDDERAKPTKRIRTRIRELGGTVPNLYRLPWQQAWRDDPYQPNKTAARIASRIESLTHKENQS